MPPRVEVKPPGLAHPFELSVHDREDLLSAALVREGIWEPYETSLVIEHLRPGEIFIDAGANIGYYTLLASTIVGPGGRVFAFEPESLNFELLARNCRDQKVDNVTLHNVALTDSMREVTLFLSPDNLGDHRLFDPGEREGIRVRAAVGDTLLSGQIDSIDFVKVDTQGAECMVIDGLKVLIGASPSIRMIVEFWPYGLDRCGGSARALVESLARHGLEFQIIDHIGHSLVPATPEQLIYMAEEGDLLPEYEGFINLFCSRRLPAAN